MAAKNSDEPEGLYELTFGFIDEGIEFQSCENSLESNISYSSREILMDEEEEDGNVNDSEENKAFWAIQEELLKTTLCRTTSFESKVRKSTKEALKELKFTSFNCSCRKMVSDGCRKCMQREISDRLTNEGYNCFICKSKWKSTPEILSGEYTYMEVVANASSKKGEMKVIIELNFRGEFEMARANEGYNCLVEQLPEVYVGKIERLRNLIKILCCASKKCMKEKKMHLAPWRKHKYMQAKYLGSPEIKSETIFPVNNFRRLPRPSGSMLTFDLLDSLTPAIKVI
ncbi:uncharacterized protein [Solanum tuberosum]|uniref:Uncharacterized protein n=1 Tax=Solanum tuberosum TaxID=4113 RepID=M1BKB9_SOLTU|nr:PREDICTED: uncharacterized protein LOC102592154 [Solanum tuberosum]KAH0651125.1 hypothetical protein KY284_031037 [Solanum tuberosum]